MKKIKFFTICLLSIVAMAVNAQTTKGWDGVRVSYNSFTFDGGVSYSPTQSLYQEGSEDYFQDWDAVMGLEIGYIKSFSISKGLPLFLETGASLLWVNGDLREYNEDFSDEYENDIIEEKTSVNMFSLIVPVNVGYKFDINEDFSVFPYAGAYFRANITGKLKDELNDHLETQDNYSNEIDMFDKDEGDGSRFQVGLQIGTTLNYKETYNLGISYGFDINEVMKKVDSSKFAVTLGYNF